MDEANNNQIRVETIKEIFKLKECTGIEILKEYLNAIPLYGPIISLVLSPFFPNTRRERIVDLLNFICIELQNYGMEIGAIQEKMKDKRYLDIFEDSAIQAARALKAERIEYIAKLFKNCITQKICKYENEKHLFYLLGQLTEKELIILIGLGQIFSKNNFYKQHKEMIIGPADNLPMDKEREVDLEIYRSQLRKLKSLGLITFQSPNKKDITILGKILLEYLDVEVNA